MSVEEAVESARELLTLEELTNRVGLSVRNIRFYTTKGLVPPPLRRGRSGYYSPDHVARLELVQELQTHGFTLSAIERYLSRIPTDASPEDITLHRTMLAPWQAQAPEEMTRTELDRRTNRKLTDDELATLSALGIVMRTKRGRYQVAMSQLTVGLGLLDLGFPTEAAVAAADVYAEHGRRSPRSWATCSGRWCGRSTRSPAPLPRRCARSWSASSRSRSRPWWRRTSRRWTRPTARRSPSARADPPSGEP